MENLLEYTSKKEEVRKIIEKTLEGFIILTKLNNKYVIIGLIILSPEMVIGSRSIKLLYGVNSRLRKTLIINLMEYLSDVKNLVIYTNVYNNEDFITYIKLGYTYYDLELDNNGKFLYRKIKYIS